MLGGKFGTNVFVILGVYFLCDSEFKSIRVVKLWMQTFFYMIVLNIVDIVLFHAKINSIVWIKSFLPILGRSYWFASSYIILLILIPLLNCVYSVALNSYEQGHDQLDSENEYIQEVLV